MPPTFNLAQQTGMMDLFCENPQMGYNQVTVVQPILAERC
jgi:hypothetical protein